MFLHMKQIVKANFCKVPGHVGMDFFSKIFFDTTVFDFSIVTSMYFGRMTSQSFNGKKSSNISEFRVVFKLSVFEL